MNKIKMIGLLLTILNFSAIAGVPNSYYEIKKVVERSYANGAFNRLDTKAMSRGFHPEFEIYSADGEQISRYPISSWIAAIEKRKASPDFDPKIYKYDYRFKKIDTIGNTGAVIIQFSQNQKPVYTDFLLLLKFSNGWKIVSKVYHSHK